MRGLGGDSRGLTLLDFRKEPAEVVNKGTPLIYPPVFVFFFFTRSKKNPKFVFEETDPPAEWKRRRASSKQR